MLLSIMATAFCAHFLSPQFLSQLSTTKAADGTEESKLSRFNILTAGGFLLSAVLSAPLTLTRTLVLALALALALTTDPNQVLSAPLTLALALALP